MTADCIALLKPTSQYLFVPPGTQTLSASLYCDKQDRATEIKSDPLLVRLPGRLVKSASASVIPGTISNGANYVEVARWYSVIQFGVAIEYVHHQSEDALPRMSILFSMP